MKMQTSVIFVKKIETKYLKDKNFCEVGDDCYDRLLPWSWFL